MARFIYGSNDISASTFPSWSNEIAEGSGNISQSVAFGDFYPAQSSPDFGLQILQGASVFYGNVVPGTGGTVQVNAPYSVGATTSTVTVKNLDISAHSITLYARANYPYAFDSWRTATGGGGSSIATTNTVTLTDASIADHNNYYAHFTTTHLSPGDTSNDPSFSGTTLEASSANACAASVGTTYYFNGDETNNFPILGDTVFTANDGSTNVSAGYIKMSNNNYIRTNASGVVIEVDSC